MLYKYVYFWSNNSKRKTLKGRKCRVLKRGKKNSILIEFENGQKEITSRYAIRRIKVKLRLRYKHIHFTKCEENFIGIAYRCFNNKKKNLLATIEYYEEWKKYVVEFQRAIIFDADCLRDIMDFLDQLKKG